MSWLVIYCLLCSSSPQTVADTLYGTYVIPEERINLNLSPPNNYTLFITQVNQRSEAVNSQELSRGQFAMRADTVVLEDLTTGKAMKLLASDEEKLRPIEVPGLDEDAEFLGQTQYYADGTLKWEGEWRKGKKHGMWIYYDEFGDVMKSVRFRRGKEIDY